MTKRPMDKPSRVLEETIVKAEDSLNQLNLDVALHRVNKGMSVQLVHLYRAMGKLSAKLMIIQLGIKDLESIEDEVERLWLCVKNS